MNTLNSTRRDFLKSVGLGAAGMAAMGSTTTLSAQRPAMNSGETKEITKTKYALKTRTVKLDDSWDVIVAGGGASGCTAATAAAREGAKTLLIEATGMLGGMGTAGLVPAWCPFTDGEKIIYGGLAKKVFLESKKGVPHVPPKKIHGHLPLNPEQLKRVYDNLVTKVGVKVVFHTRVASVEMNSKDMVDAILCANKSGLTAYRAKIYVDCTGDGDIAAWAGAEFGKGDEKTGKIQRSTHCFILSNVNTFEYLYGPDLYHDSEPGGPIWKILNDKMCTNLVGPDTVGFNAGHLEADNTDPDSISQAMMDGRKLAEKIRKSLAKVHPKAFGGAFLVTTAPLMGTRETRRIVGDYILTIKDYIARRSFPDEIGRNCYHIDLHMKGAFEENEKAEYYKKGESYGVPYRCLTPKGLRNVLVAGRCISSTHPIQASIRVMPPCLVTGEAAGLAAAEAIKNFNSDVHAVDTDRLRTRLREEGAYLP